MDYRGFRLQQKEAWRQGRYVGVGLSIYVETSAGGSWSFARRGMPVAGFDTSVVRVLLPSARVEVFTSAATQGQSHETVFAQLVADTLGLPLERVAVTEGDTQLVAYGTGTFGSRSAVMAGGAALLAARRVRDKAVRIAAHLLEAAPEDVLLDGGAFTVRGAAGRKVGWEEVARAAYLATYRLPSGLGPGLEASAHHDLPVDHTPCSYGVHAAVVEVTPETGVFTIQRYVIVEDCGTMLNPVVVEGQLLGALAQGIGTAVYEHLVYDESGQLLTASLMDYAVPTAAQVPAVEIHHLVTPSPYTLTGAKGMAEGGSAPPPAVLANAICDALRPLGVEITALPLTPERIWRAIAAASRPGGSRTSCRSSWHGREGWRSGRRRSSWLTRGGSSTSSRRPESCGRRRQREARLRRPRPARSDGHRLLRGDPRPRAAGLTLARGAGASGDRQNDVGGTAYVRVLAGELPLVLASAASDRRRGLRRGRVQATCPKELVIHKRDEPGAVRCQYDSFPETMPLIADWLCDRLDHRQG